MRKRFIFASIFIIILVALALYAISFIFMRTPNPNMRLGVSFDPTHARWIGVDVSSTYKQILDDWGFKLIRLSAHWDGLQPKKGEDFNFAELDYLMGEAQNRDAKIVLAFGQKTPRWPECHLPVWLNELNSEQAQRQLLLRYMTAVVERYKNHPALEIWQVENEPFLEFGVCPPYSKKDLTEEIALVRKLDPNHKILITDSGELSTWRNTVRAGDLFGTTLYRVVWNRFFKYTSYDWLPPAFYSFKLGLFGRTLETAVVSELQAEPWIPAQNPNNVSFDEQFRSLSLKRLKQNIDFAARIGVPRSYLWGAEWWAWAAQHGHPEFGEYIKSLKK
jgi:hypothetical protein